MTTLHFTKGHGTENDFVLLDDRHNTLNLDAPLVRALADRRAGIGGDGVIRVVRSADIPEGDHVLALEPQAQWFMDYRNADGSIAQMCGNGVRVFAAFLEQLSLVTFTPGARVPIGTRAGVRTVEKIGDWFQVGMGEYTLTGDPDQIAVGADSIVELVGLNSAGYGAAEADAGNLDSGESSVGKGSTRHATRPALSIDMGNPHTVVAVQQLDELAALDLTHAPHVQPVPPQGTNVEIVVPLGTSHDEAGQPLGKLAMRVHERGVGETRSCGTGACAAALAVRHWMTLAQEDSASNADSEVNIPDAWLVQVPGGTVKVEVRDRTVYLSGPAVLLAQGEVELEALVGK